MLTFQDLYTRVTDMFSDDSAGTVTLAKDFINEAKRKAEVIVGVEDIAEQVVLTVSGKEHYSLPASFIKMNSVRLVETTTASTTTSTSAGNLVDTAASFTTDLIGLYVYNKTNSKYTIITGYTDANTLTVEDDIFTSGNSYVIGNGNTYIAQPVLDKNTWFRMTDPSVTFNSNQLTHYFIENYRIELFPRPDTSDYIVIFNYNKKIADLSSDDYTTGTISINKGSASVTGSGTTFTSSMVGRYLKTTDGLWYRIKYFVSTTAITLETPYEGDDVSGGTYSIGQVPLIDEQFHPALSYPAIAFLYRKREQFTAAREYDSLWSDAMREMKQFASTAKDGTMTFRAKTGQKGRSLIDVRSTHQTITTSY